MRENKLKNFINFESKNQKNFFILKLTAFTVAFILFVIGSIYDEVIAKKLGDLNDNGIVSWISLFFDALAYTMTVPIMFIVVCILFESLNKKYGEKQKWIFTLMIFVYVLFIVIFIIACAFMVIEPQVNKQMGFGKGRNYWFGLEREQVIIVLTLQLVIEVAIMLSAILYFRLKFSKRHDILTHNYWIDGFKIAVLFAFVAPFGDPLLKIVFGRAYYVHVDYENVINSLPEDWIKDDYFKEFNAQYVNWWELEIFKKDYWNLILSGKEDGTARLDGAFPSGHMNSASLLVYTTVLLLMNSKKGQKQNWWKWLVFVICVLDVAIMAFMQIVSRTHYLTDLMWTIMFILLIHKPIYFLTDLVIYKILILIWNKTNQNYSLSKQIFDKKTEVFLELNGLKWRIAKFNNKKIINSTKYKKMEKYILEDRV